MRKPVDLSSSVAEALPTPVLTMPVQSSDAAEPAQVQSAQNSVELPTTNITRTFTGHRLTWNRSAIKRVIYNKTIEEWMSYYPGFANWVRSCIMLHADNSINADTVCQIPDQYRDEIGEKITISWDNCIPGKAGAMHEYKEGVIRVMG